MILKNQKKQKLKNQTDDDFDSLFPIAMKAAAKTIGLDLVKVQPLSVPVGNLNYMNFQYGPTLEALQKWEAEVIGNKIDNLLNGDPLRDIPRPT